MERESFDSLPYSFIGYLRDLRAISDADPEQQSWALALADVGVSINVGQPGFYGQIDIGDVPAPQVVYAQPMVIEQDRVYVNQPPIYLHVPPGYERHWRHHCAAYNACGRPVYFVRHDWYNTIYVPAYQEHRGGWHDRDDHDEGWQGGDHGDHGDHGHGHGHGHGHDD